MKRELLKEMGLADEAIEKIMAENGRDVEKAKGDLAGKARELEEAQAKLAELSGTVKQYEGVDVEGLKKNVEEWKTKYDQDLAQLKLDHALDTALRAAGAHDPATVLPKLDRSLLKLDGGKLLGLEEQVAGLKESSGYLFQQEQKPGPTLSSGMEHGAAPGEGALAAFVSSARAAAGLKTE